MKRFAAVVTLSSIALVYAHCATAQDSSYWPETQAEKDARMAWWREARFGMFIHWGLYAILAGEWEGEPVDGIGEWIMHRGEIPVRDYEPLAEQFNPVKFDAEEWVRVAKDAGMKYIVITSKHHDGFGLWDSEVSDYDVMDRTPFKRDILKELSDACKAQGVKLCFYHSIMDWHHPDYLPRREWERRPEGDADLERYINEYLKPQLKELITEYDPAVLWFDGEWESTWTHEHGAMLYDYVRSLKPDILINNRVDKGRQGMQGLTKEGDFRGDFGTPEQEIPETGLPGVDWESCMTMNDTWGYKKDDHNWKSSEMLIRNIVDIASKGGNYLLNVGPRADGLFPAASVQRLADIGDWMARNGESIYGTSASPIEAPSWGRCTVKPGKVFLHVFDWPEDGKLVVEGIDQQVNGASLLAGMKGNSLAVAQEGGTVTVLVPRGLDSADTVVVLEVK